MVIQRTDYTAEAVAAARSVLLEVARILGDHRDGVVVIGGWVPELLLSGGIGALADEFHPILDHPLVQEGLCFIAEKFSAPESVGPSHVAVFEGVTDPEERALLRRDVFEYYLGKKEEVPEPYS